jgi:hypothetical protein
MPAMANKTQSSITSALLEDIAILEKKVSEAKTDKIEQLPEKTNTIMLEKKSNVDSYVQQDSQKEPEPTKEPGAPQKSASFISQIAANSIKQTDNNAPKMADLNDSSVVKHRISNQDIAKIESASTLDEKRDTVTLKNKLQAFLQKYCYTYKSKQLDKFLDYFSIDAKENGKPINTLIPKYRHNFAAIDTIEYSIILEKFSHDKISDSIRIEGKFNLMWQPYNSPWRENSGKIFMDLLKHDNSFKVLNLDYYGGSSPEK